MSTWGACKGPKSLSKLLQNRCSFSESSEMRFVHYLLYFRMISPSGNGSKKASFWESVSVPHSESLLGVLKFSRTYPRQEKRSKKGPKTGPSRPAKSVARGCTNASRGNLFTFRWSDVFSECNFAHVTSFLTSKMSTFATKSHLFLRPVVAYVQQLRT